MLKSILKKTHSFKITSNNLSVIVLLLSTCARIMISLTYPLGSGPDWVLYPGSAIELFSDTISNPYIMIDRNGYYPFLIWPFIQFENGLNYLVILQHFICILLTIWTVRLMYIFLGKPIAILCALVLSLYQPLLIIAHITNSETACLIPLWGLFLCTLSIIYRNAKGEKIPFILWFGFSLFGSLATVARPSGLLLLFSCIVTLWILKTNRRVMLKIVLCFICFSLIIPLYNYYRLGYFGLEKKAGRTLFALVYMTDHTYSPSNGPYSQKVADLLRDAWPELLVKNTVVQKNNENIEDLLSAPEELPYDLYYLIVNLARKKYPYDAADKILLSAAMEAIQKHKSKYIVSRLKSLLISIIKNPYHQLKFRLSNTAKPPIRTISQAKDRRYAGTSILYTMRGYHQTEEQVSTFQKKYMAIRPSEKKQRWNTGIKLCKVWHETIQPAYIVIYFFIFLFLYIIYKYPHRIYSDEYRKEIMMISIASILYCIGNRVFVYAVSKGDELHLLPHLPFELIFFISGIYGACALHFMSKNKSASV